MSYAKCGILVNLLGDFKKREFVCSAKSICYKKPRDEYFKIFGYK